MKSFTQFVTEYAGLAAPEADAELRAGIQTLMRAGKKIPSVPGKNVARLTHKITSAADAVGNNLDNSAAGQAQRGVSAMGY